VSAKSHYVNEEIRLFKQRQPKRPVVPLVIDGKPDDPRARMLSASGSLWHNRARWARRSPSSERGRELVSSLTEKFSASAALDQDLAWFDETLGGLKEAIAPEPQELEAQPDPHSP
jgi:hypothetical protein